MTTVITPIHTPAYKMPIQKPSNTWQHIICLNSRQNYSQSNSLWKNNENIDPRNPFQKYLLLPTRNRRKMWSLHTIFVPTTELHTVSGEHFLFTANFSREFSRQFYIFFQQFMLFWTFRTHTHSLKDNFSFLVWTHPHTRSKLKSKQLL